MNLVRLRVVFFAAALLAGGISMAASDKNTISDGADQQLMLRGKDPVSYFAQPAPLDGSRDIKADYDGVTYRFATEENKRLFLADPQKYVPQNGGHCSNGMVYAIGGSNGEAHRIIDGKLFVFGGERSRAYFEMDLEKNRRLADHYWTTEYQSRDWREISNKRARWDRVPHYKTNRELAGEYEEYLAKRKPQ